MREHRVAYLPGDGIGAEVCDVARRCVDAAGVRFDFEVAWDEQLVGGAAIDARRRGTARGDAGGVRAGRRGATRRRRWSPLGRPVPARRRGRRMPCWGCAPRSSCSRTCAR